MLTRVLRSFFHHFYHEFAWTYDLVAALVSVGRWNRWIEAAIPYLHGRDILELGFGRGHLQERLLSRADLRVFGLDESLQMAELAVRYLRARNGLSRPKLTRGRAQRLPFTAGSFDTVVSTFPSEYIFDRFTVAEIARVLRAGGRLVVMPGASILGRGAIDRVASWVSEVSHQSPPTPEEGLAVGFQDQLRAAGFRVTPHVIEVLSSLVFLIEAQKASQPD